MSDSNKSNSESNGYLNLNDCESGNRAQHENDLYNLKHLTESKTTSHSFQIRFFYKPVLCIHCMDYIWGSGYIGYGCTTCANCVHFKCLIFVAKSQNCIEKQDSLDELNSKTKSNMYPLENWSNDLVKQWLSVVNLHRYAEVFAKYNINGSKLITLNTEQLFEYRIRDSYHHKAILECCQELYHKSRQYATYSQMLKEQTDFVNKHLKINAFKASAHHFLVHTLSKQSVCDTCARPLLGIVHQSLLCQQCGLMVHRQCSSIGLPECKRQAITGKHYLFGVSLFDQQEENLVPALLVKAFNHIEERALQTGEDLYDAYRLSADTVKIDQIKQQLNENGIELTRFDRYDLNTVAAIVKAYLRDLQNSVIPEEIYFMLVECIQTISTSELKELIRQQLHPQHLACLEYIMAHLIRVWSYQFKTRGCHYLPDKLFHIFRSILMRPPWHQIIEIVYNIEKQTLVIQRLMLECDWGEELPEYRIRPKRPLSPTLSNESNNSITSNLAHLAFRFLPNSKTFSKLNSHLNNTKPMSIENQEWFWDNIVNRDNTSLILKNCPDGSFIVRNSSDKNASAPYTLCVMKGTFVKSIKIFKQETHGNAYINNNENNGNTMQQFLYDIEKPCRFESVQALIDYYSRVSLKEYNHNLDLKLSYGVSKFKFGRASEWSIDKLYSSFKDALEKYEQLMKNCDSLESDITIIREDLTHKKVACDAFDKIIEMYEMQTEEANAVLTNNLIKKQNAISASGLLATQFMPQQEGNEASRIEQLMLDNKLRLESKLIKLRAQKEDIFNQIEYLNMNLSELQEKLDMLRPELVELRKKRENYHMWLLQRGENEDKIHTIIEPNNSNLNSKDSSTTITDNNRNSKLVIDNLTKLNNELEQRSLAVEGFGYKNTSVSMCNLSEINDHSISNSSIATVATLLNTKDEQQIFSKMNSSFSFENSINSNLNLCEFGSQQKTESNEFLPSSNMASAHSDSLNWFRADLTRENAELTLKGRTNGTYLVRSSLYPGSKYVLSVVYQTQPIHILIDEHQNHYFLKSNYSQQRRFAAAGNKSSYSKLNSVEQQESSRSRSPSQTSISNNYEEFDTQQQQYARTETQLKFNTLTDLITYYSVNHLRIGNQYWNISLTFPAFLEEYKNYEQGL